MDANTVAGGGPTIDSSHTSFSNVNANRPEEEDIDPIWLSSRTARQIYGLCQVEKVSIRYHPTRTQNEQTDILDG